MAYRWVRLGLIVFTVCGFWSPAEAEVVPSDSSTLTVDALPLEAEVLLDGVRLGTARDLISRALPVLPGDHVVQVSAAGYLRSFVTVPGIPNWTTRVEVYLVPDRRP
jgi:PEGA domain-containing protein